MTDTSTGLASYLFKSTRLTSHGLCCDVGSVSNTSGGHRAGRLIHLAFHTLTANTRLYSNRREFEIVLDDDDAARRPLDASYDARRVCAHKSSPGRVRAPDTGRLGGWKVLTRQPWAVARHPGAHGTHSARLGPCFGLLRPCATPQPHPPHRRHSSIPGGHRRGRARSIAHEGHGEVLARAVGPCLRPPDPPGMDTGSHGWTTTVSCARAPIAAPRFWDPHGQRVTGHPARQLPLWPLRAGVERR